jgi:integrase
VGSAHVLVRVRGADGRWRAPTDGVRGGERRYLVRWRFAGRDSRLRHGGSFRTRREAELRRRYLLDEIAAGRIPDVNPGLAVERTPTVAEVIRDYIDAKVDIEERSRGNLRCDRNRLPADILAMRVGEVTRPTLQRWVVDQVEEGRGANAISRTVTLIRVAIQAAGVEPNPADGVIVPTYRAPEVNPPSIHELRRLLEVVRRDLHPLICFIEGSGLRVGELAKLLQRDVDRRGGQLRVGRPRTKGRSAGERWIPLRPATIDLIPPPRTSGSEERAFRFSVEGLQEAMHDGCLAAGLRPITPHMLRHRYASRLIAQGKPVTVVRDRLGHTLKSMTLDVYSHVLLTDDVDPVFDLAELVDLN